MINRRFGVEIEFDSNGLGSAGVARLLGNTFDKYGLRRWYFRDRIDYDGSELELKTPILSGKRGFKTLEIVMNTLVENNCFVTEADGLHVHHDAPEFINNIDNCIRLVKSWNQNRHLIYEFVDPERGSQYDGDYWACPRWTDSAIEELERKREIPYWNRNDLNLLALNEHGSIEIRLHEGTLDYSEAESWIRFGQRFIDNSLKHSMREAKDAEHLLKKIRVAKGAEKVLIDKAKYRQSRGPRRDYPSNDDYYDGY